jgi:hypothetical protein
MSANIIDVLESVLGDLSSARLQRLSEDELESVSNAVNDHYVGWTAPATDDGFRLYSGGWIAGNTEHPAARAYLYTSLLYAPAVVIHDPVADWFDPKRDFVKSLPPIHARVGGMQVDGSEASLRRRDGYFAFPTEPDRSRLHLLAHVPALQELAPLIRRGVVVPIPQWQIVRQHQLGVLSTVNHDVKDAALAELITANSEQPLPRTDRIRGSEVAPNGGVAQGDALRAVVQNPAYFLNKTLAIAAATGSRYVPPAATDARFFDYKLKLLGRELQRRDIDMRVVSALSSTDLPFLAGVDIPTIVKIRSNESAFEDWRAALRNVARTIQSLPATGDEFVAEARDALADALQPAAKEVRDAVSRSTLMKAAAKEQALNLGLGAATVAGGAAVTGSPLDAGTLAPLGLAAIFGWILKSITGPNPTGSNTVLATLVRNW